MSGIEERLVRDITAVTGGVVVTESDLRIARDAINERVDNRRQRNRRRTLVGAAAAAILVVVLGATALQTIGGEGKTAPPADPGPTTTDDPHAEFLTGSAPTPELLQGIWRLDNGGVLMRFAPPDLVSFDNSGRLFESPAVQGRYEIDGDLITVTVDGGPAGCGGQQLAMRASLPEPGSMRLVHTQPGTGNCGQRQDEAWVMEQVLPPGPVFTELALSNEQGATWTALTDKELLHGSWFAEGREWVLELAPNGQYHLAATAGEQVDYGAWELRGSQLTLTSWPDSVQCDASDELVLGGLEYYDPGTTVVRSTVRKDSCRAAWADVTWIQIPDDSTR